MAKTEVELIEEFHKNSKHRYFTMDIFSLMTNKKLRNSQVAQKDIDRLSQELESLLSNEGIKDPEERRNYIEKLVLRFGIQNARNGEDLEYVLKEFRLDNDTKLLQEFFNNELEVTEPNFVALAYINENYNITVTDHQLEKIKKQIAEDYFPRKIKEFSDLVEKFGLKKDEDFLKGLFEKEFQKKKPNLVVLGYLRRKFDVKLEDEQIKLIDTAVVEKQKKLVSDIKKDSLYNEIIEQLKNKNHKHKSRQTIEEKIEILIRDNAESLEQIGIKKGEREIFIKKLILEKAIKSIQKSEDFQYVIKELKLEKDTKYLQEIFSDELNSREPNYTVLAYLKESNLIAVSDEQLDKIKEVISKRYFPIRMDDFNNLVKKFRLEGDAKFLQKLFDNELNARKTNFVALATLKQNYEITITEDQLVKIKEGISTKYFPGNVEAFKDLAEIFGLEQKDLKSLQKLFDDAIKNEQPNFKGLAEFATKFDIVVTAVQRKKLIAGLNKEKKDIEAKIKEEKSQGYYQTYYSQDDIKALDKVIKDFEQAYASREAKITEKKQAEARKKQAEARKKQAEVKKERPKKGKEFHEAFLEAVTDNKVKKVNKYLKSEGFDINYQDSQGETALHKALASAAFCVTEEEENSYNMMIKLLIRSGADPTIENNDGYTPRELYDIEYDGLINMYATSDKTGPAIIDKKDYDRNEEDTIGNKIDRFLQKYEQKYEQKEVKRKAKAHAKGAKLEKAAVKAQDSTHHGSLPSIRRSLGRA